MDSSFEIIEAILKQKGPMRSSDLKKLLTKNGQNDNALRKQISRAHSKGKIKVIKEFKLPKGEDFVFLEEQYETNIYWINLQKALIETNSAHGIALCSLIARKCMSRNEFNVACGATIDLKKHLTIEQVLKDLIYLKLVKIEIGYYGEYLLLNKNERSNSNNISDTISRNEIEQILIDKVYEWSRNLCLASYDAIKKKVDNFSPNFGHFYWDITAPTYIYPIAQKLGNSTKPGFLAIDVSLSSLDKESVKYFIKKCSIIRSIKNMSSFLPILIASSFQKEAFELGKKNGIIFTTPQNLFGIDVSNSFKQLILLLSNSKNATKSSSETLKIVDSLIKVEGYSNNLKGILFEFLVGNIVQVDLGGELEFRKKFLRNHPDQGGTDADIILTKNKNFINIYECKGINSKNEISKENVIKWIETQICLIYDKLKQDPSFSNTKITFAFWTSGNFSDEAKAYLEEAKSNTKIYNIEWKNGLEILDCAKKTNNANGIRILKEQFLNNPPSIFYNSLNQN